MKKEYIQIGVIGLGLAMLPILIMSNMKKTPSKSTAPVAPAVVPAGVAAGPDAVSIVRAEIDDRILDIQSKRLDLPWGRDPFLTMSDSVGKMNEFQLKGISFAQDKKGYAFINDEIVSAGDSISGYEVEVIEKDRVKLKRGAQTFFLTFSEQE